ncbi:hypothetical protein [Acidovorax kalamii]|uniref:hypothetical protein n=1 Tax=Acidovorax kalamii TaxID=2004485 RepID=UPI00197AE152|nr:hypothetical protein [Acidovorax kalamii]
MSMATFSFSGASFHRGDRPVHRAIKSTGVVCLIAALSACASIAPRAPEQQVQARAETYWRARIAGDVKAAYALLTPAYRSLRDEQAFQRQFGAQIAVLESKVTNVACEAEKCIARVGLTTKPVVPGLGLPTVTAYLDETWLLVDGQWWRHEAP